MSFMNKLAYGVGRSLRMVLRKMGRGGNLPGKVANAISPSILTELTKDYKIILVTGTNGKTTTTSLIYQILLEAGYSVLSNRDGSNMTQGITTAFLQKSPKSDKEKWAVIEVDEAYLRKVTKLIQTEAIVLTNIFRDQMDRYGEIYTTFKLLNEGIVRAPEAKIISNGDFPLFSTIKAKDCVFFGFEKGTVHDGSGLKNVCSLICPSCGTILNYSQITYSNLGDYQCPGCGKRRPELDYAVKDYHLYENHSDVVIDDTHFTVPLPGLFNVYNFLGAYALAKSLGITNEAIQKGSMKNLERQGRQEHLHLDETDVILHLVKNPVGLTETIRLLSFYPEPLTVVFLLNNQDADGVDESWVWDADLSLFGTLTKSRFVIGGDCEDTVYLRLRVEGIEDERITRTQDFDEVHREILSSQTPIVLASYTANRRIRSRLIQGQQAD